MENYYETNNETDHADSETPLSGNKEIKTNYKTIVSAIVVFVLITAGSAGLFYYLKNKNQVSDIVEETSISLLPVPGSEIVDSKNSTIDKPDKDIEKPSLNEINSKEEIISKEDTNVTPKYNFTSSASAYGEKTSTSTYESLQSSSASAASSSNGGTVYTSSGDGYASAYASSENR